MSTATELDIRWPIGLLFAIIGALLAIYGASSPARTVFRPDMGAPHVLNLDLWWGLVMLLFGVLMISGAVRKSRTKPEEKNVTAAGKGTFHS